MLSQQHEQKLHLKHERDRREGPAQTHCAHFVPRCKCAEQLGQVSGRRLICWLILASEGRHLIAISASPATAVLPKVEIPGLRDNFAVDPGVEALE